MDPEVTAAAEWRAAVLLLDAAGRSPRRVSIARAASILARALRREPGHAASHALLGHLYDLHGEPKRALASFRRAQRLAPRSRVYAVYVITLLVELGRERSALGAMRVAARRQRVDLDALRRRLLAAGMPANADNLLLNGFVRARPYFRSWLADEAGRVREALEPGRAQRETMVAERHCAEAQRRLARSVERSRVPPSVRPLAQWAARFGVGDDVCRSLLLHRLAKRERAALIRAVDRHASAAHRWLDGFGRRRLPAAAAACLYLLAGVEEIRPVA